MLANRHHRTAVALHRALRCALLLLSLVVRVSSAHAQSDNLTFGEVHVLWSDSIAPTAKQAVERTSVSAFTGPAGETAFTAAMRRILVTLESDGYRHARVSPGDFTSDGTSLALTLRITPGPRSRVIDYGFANCTHTDTLWLRKQVAQPVGVPLTADWLRAAAARLARLSNVRVASEPEITTVEDNPGASEESVVVRWPLDEDRNARLDGVLAAGGEDAQSGLTGHASMQLDGLFGRDRSIAVRYNRPRPQWNALNLSFAERGAFGGPFDWGLELSTSNQLDRRQRIATRIGLAFGRSADWSVGAAAAWQRITPIVTGNTPARNIDASLGIEKTPRLSARRRSTDISGNLWTTLSHRQTYSGASSVAADRLRIDAHASLTRVLGRNWDLSLMSAARAWLSGRSALGFGDEWYLGGTDHMRGYDDQTFAAASGVWAAAEIGYWCVPSLGLSLFGEAARITEIEAAGSTTGTTCPVDYGAALRLISGGRVGRLEFAWRRDAALRDGYVRLKVTQSW